MPTPNPTIFEALAFAVEAHGAVLQVRKGTRFPYVIHPIRVAEILQLFGADDELVIAGLLHDTIEDAEITAAEIESRFGPHVARLVAGASEPDKEASWQERKQHTIDHLRGEADHDTLMVAAADKLDNARSIRETLGRAGEDETWTRFKKGRADQHWYYRGLAEVFLEREPNNVLFRTLDCEVQTLFPDTTQETRLFGGKPIQTAHDVRAYLGDPIKHWKLEHSAYELARSWVGAEGLPAEIDTVLRNQFGPCELVEGIFEKETPLPGGTRSSQTDLLTLLRTRDGFLVVGVEGKAREPFGQLVPDWNTGSPTKAERLAYLCERLGLEPGNVNELRYQLLHRTVATVLEGERYGASQAVMLVHSFDQGDASLDDYRAFASALGITGADPGELTSPLELGGMTLRLGWAKAPPR